MRQKLTPELKWALEPAVPEWPENFCALHTLTYTWSPVQSHWTLLRSTDEGFGWFYVELVHSGMSFEDFQELTTRNPPP